MITHTVHDNIAALRQGIRLLSGLSAASYAKRTPACFNSSAGGHVRHIIEHYVGFLHGTETGEIDYEARARDPLIETDPHYAIGQLESINDRLELLSVDRGLRVRSESALADAEAVWCDSSVLRELEFLLSHTVHHYALIGVICQLDGHVLPKDFGMAPSTLRFLRKQALAACAP